MMTINLLIKANVNNISLSQIYELLRNYTIDDNKKDKDFYELNGFKFKIEVEVNMGITYRITEIF